MMLTGIETGSNSTTGAGSSLSASKRAGIIAGAVIGGLFCIVSSLGFCVICSKRRDPKKDDPEARRHSKFKRIISKPYPQRTTETQDVWAIGTYTDPDLGSDAPTGDFQEPMKAELAQENIPPRVQLNFKPTQANHPSEGPALEDGSFLHRLVSRHSLLAANRRSTIYEEDGLNSGEAIQAAVWQGQGNAKRARDDITMRGGEAEINYASSSMYSVEEAKQAAFEVAALQPFGSHVFRPLPSLGHGQLPFDATWQRSSVLAPRTRPQSTGSEIGGLLYNDADGTLRYLRRSIVGHAVRPLSNISARGSALSRKGSGKRNSRPLVIQRPVSRRGPYPSTFFSGGSHLQRKGSVASKIFTDYGPGLTSMSGSPILYANKQQVAALDSQPGANIELREVEKQLQPNQTLPQSLHHKRSQSDWTWSIRESDMGSPSWHTIGHGAASSFDENFDSVPSDVSSARGVRPFQSRAVEDRAAASQPIEGGLSIMERGRAAYRRRGSRDRTPLQSLGINEKIGFAKIGKRKGKERLSDVGKLFLRGSIEQRPRSVEVDVGRFRSQRGETVDGNEAFL
jgi:hypothetical protein